MLRIEPGKNEMKSKGWSESIDGMRIDWDAPIEMDDGAVLRCDVFRPDGDLENIP